jgi:hypothetical protein
MSDARSQFSMADAVSLVSPNGNAVKNSIAMTAAGGGNGIGHSVPHLVDFVARANDSAFKTIRGNPWLDRTDDVSN